MARFKAEGVIVRELEQLTIIFWDRESIWVVTKDGQRVIFHRWFAPRGSYCGRGDSRVRWRDFRRKMLRNRHPYGLRSQSLSLIDCCKLANECGVLIKSTDRELKLEGRKVIYRK